MASRLIKKKARGGRVARVGGWLRRLARRVRRPAQPWVVAYLREFPEAAYELRVRRADGCWQVVVLDEDRREVVRVDAATRGEASAVMRAVLGRMSEGGTERLPAGYRFGDDRPFDPVGGDYGAAE
jgi:hypothetical protein